MNNRLSQLNLDRNGDREHLSDIESQTDSDSRQSEADKEEIRQIFDISHALETIDDYKEIKEWINQDATLFVYSQKDKILSIIETNLKRSKPVNIVVTRSRRISARSLCEHISISRNWPVGQTVGYQTSLNKQHCELTRISYCTTDVNAKIILTSATIDVETLAHFFRQVINGQILLVYQFNVDDRLFDVQEIYLEHIQNYGLLLDLKLTKACLSREAINLAVNLIKSFDNENSMAGWDHTKNLPINRATVLVFLLGLLEIQTVYETLRFPRGKPDSMEFNPDYYDECIKFNYDIIPLHSKLSMDDQMNIFTPDKNTYRNSFNISTVDKFLGSFNTETGDVENKRTIEDNQEKEYVLALVAVDDAKQNNPSKEKIEALEKEKDNKNGIDADEADAKRTKRQLSKKDKSAFKTFSQIVAKGLGLGDEPDYVNVKAMSTLIKKDTAVFMAEISNATGAQWITLLGNIAETLLGMTADDFGKYKLNQKESIIEDVIRKAMNHERTFKLCAKAKQYNHERKIRFTCVSVSDVDWSSHGRRLTEEINQMEPVQH